MATGRSFPGADTFREDAGRTALRVAASLPYQTRLQGIPRPLRDEDGMADGDAHMIMLLGFKRFISVLVAAGNVLPAISRGASFFIARYAAEMSDPVPRTTTSLRVQ